MRDPRAILNSRKQAHWRQELRDIDDVCFNLRSDLKIGKLLPQERYTLYYCWINHPEPCLSTGTLFQIFSCSLWWTLGGEHNECYKAAVQILRTEVWRHGPETRPQADPRGGGRTGGLPAGQTRLLPPQSLAARDGEENWEEDWTISWLSVLYEEDELQKSFCLSPLCSWEPVIITFNSVSLFAVLLYNLLSNINMIF